MTSTVDLPAAISSHPADLELPRSWSVHLVETPAQITVQVSYRGTPDLASALLAWADTLTTAVNAYAGRTPDGASVHLSVTGERPSDVPMIYGAVPVTSNRIGGDLAPGETTTIPLGVLRALAQLGEVTL